MNARDLAKAIGLLLLSLIMSGNGCQDDFVTPKGQIKTLTVTPGEIPGGTAAAGNVIVQLKNSDASCQMQPFL